MLGQEFVYASPAPSYPSDQFAGGLSHFMVPGHNHPRPQGGVGGSNSGQRVEYSATAQEYIGGTTFFYPQGSQAVPVFADSNSFMGPPSHVGQFHSTTAGYNTAAGIRQDLIFRQLASQMYLPPEDSRCPQNIERYFAVCPLEPIDASSEMNPGSLGFTTTCYKAVNSKDNLVYMLRRVHGYRLSGAKTPHLIDQWKKLNISGVATLREVFQTKTFKDHSAVFVYDYHAGSETLMSRHFSSVQPASPHKQRPSNPVPGGTGISSNPYGPRTGHTNLYSSGQSLIPEALLWSYIVQLTGTLRNIHDAGLAARVLFPNKILISGQSRLRLSCVGLLDIVEYENGANNSATVARHQQDDLLSLGRILLALACNSSLVAIQRENVQKALETVAMNYSSDVKNLILYLLGGQQHVRSINEVMPMIGARFYTQVENCLMHNDLLENELTKELENGRLFKLLAKLGVINERPQFGLDHSWSETGDRYLLKLFRDYLFHQVTDSGAPWLDLSHIVQTLNKLDASSPERLCLMSRDEQSVMVVSYQHLNNCLSSSFTELQQACNSDVQFASELSS
ncbi:PAN2-PAN3 deadenylation complex subunit pan3-like isoform X2 [Corticium candelabrum]|nr:PAN2-PAN3 deadenylation complex subunit pan3-like isoform X2 [Corticium candelabrum]